MEEKLQPWFTSSNILELYMQVCIPLHVVMYFKEKYLSQES